MLVRKFKEVAEKIKNLDGKILVFTDSDNDGKASGLLLKAILQKLGKEFEIIPLPHGKLDPNDLKKQIEKKKPNAIIMADLAYKDEYLVDLAKAYPDLPIIYIDHHKREVPKDLPENLTYFDVRALGLEPVPCTAATIYRIGKQLFGEEFTKYSHIAAIGAVGDFVFHEDLLLRRDFAKAYPLYYLNGIAFSPVFQDLYMLLTLASTKAVVEMDPDNLLPNKDAIKSASKTVKKLYSSLLSLKPIYIDDNIEVYKAKNNSSFVASFLSVQKPNKIIIVVSKAKLSFLDKLPFVEREYKVSIRNQSGEFDVGKITASCPNKVQGGGHPKAAGARIKKNQLQGFIECFKKAVEEKKGKQ